MPQINREDILKKVNEIAKALAEQEEVQTYQKAEEQIKKNKRVQGLITEIKIKQQELVHAKHFKKTNYIKQLEDELDSLNHELNEIPLVKQYQQLQAELNKDIQYIFKLLKDEISQNIPLEEE